MSISVEGYTSLEYNQRAYLKDHVLYISDYYYSNNNREALSLDIVKYNELDKSTSSSLSDSSFVNHLVKIILSKL